MMNRFLTWLEGTINPPVVDEEWIGQHGSESLKRLLSEGGDCKEMYFRERLRTERPGFQELDSRSRRAPMCPTDDDWKSLDAARRIAPDAHLLWMPCRGAVARHVPVATFLGRTIVKVSEHSP